MLNRLVYIGLIILLVLGSIAFTRFLSKKIKLNRWVIGFSSPLVLIVPSILFKNMNEVVWNILLLIFAVMCIMFFEITRKMFQNNEIKGIVHFDKENK